MSDIVQSGPQVDSPSLLPMAPAGLSETPAAFFERTDWLALALTTLLVLAVYLMTLSPDVTLGNAGAFAVAADYAGVGPPPGYPLWTLYGWMFTVILPFSNIAWRLAVASAVAGALTCGVVALMVSRWGGMILSRTGGAALVGRPEEKPVRLVCGAVAGAGLGFDGGFWCSARIGMPWTLSMLVFSLVVCLLMKWFFAPTRRRWLVAAFFVYGLTLSNSQLLLTAALGIGIIMALAEVKLARDVCLAGGLLFGAGWWANYAGELPVLDGGGGQGNLLRTAFFVAGLTAVLVCAGMTWRTRALLTEWRTLLPLPVALLGGAALYLYLPIASMTNPPMNWGYARTVPGFEHVLARGQFERILPTQDCGRLLQQLFLEGKVAVREFGLLYLLATGLSFCSWRRMKERERRWMAGLAGLFSSVTVLMVVVVNPSNDRNSYDFCKVIFSASHLILALWAGAGLVWLAAVHAGRAACAPPSRAAATESGH